MPHCAGRSGAVRMVRALLCTPPMNSSVRRTVHGALGGLIGAACMTVVRMLAHRAKLIDQMVPQAVETWAKHRLPISLPAVPSQRAWHHVADQMLHLGYGSGLGAVYGLTWGKGPASLKKVV